MYKSCANFASSHTVTPLRTTTRQIARFSEKYLNVQDFLWLDMITVAGGVVRLELLSNAHNMHLFVKSDFTRVAVWWTCSKYFMGGEYNQNWL